MLFIDAVISNQSRGHPFLLSVSKTMPDPEFRSMSSSVQKELKSELKKYCLVYLLCAVSIYFKKIITYKIYLSWLWIN